MLAALTPALRDLFEVARIFQDTNLEHGGVVDVMDALEPAAFLVTRAGRVVHANAVARALHRSAPPWLRDVVRSPVPDHPLVRIRPMRVDGVPLFFVQYRGAPPVLETSTLPPSLERVRALMARGCSDKDIAAALGLSLATARTYATRVLQRLELHDRRQLMVGSQRDRDQEP